ncbi:42963_t:CDS:2 [Gigaspora margarita]|uniref:42963_t:CDS:1 n=1 Tax=Gigaspora margarita TaxID=4874 RepID=A0ABN7U303_GIGMA|nr:42963_t:CDS:2 [Gigaspora margarita]
MKTDITIPCLVTDVIIRIFENVNIRDLFSILLVNREWCRLAIPLYWRAPFSYTKTRSKRAIKIYRLFLKKKPQSITKQNLPTLFDYPLFLKELNYANLLEYDRTIVNVREILKLLIDRGINLNTFVMDNTAALGEHIYGLWTDSCYNPMFNSLVYVKIYSPFPKNRVIKTLVDNCTKLSHLDINLYDNSPGRIKMMLNYLEELFNAQKCINFEIHHLKISTAKSIKTTHWHFGNDDKISNFYFHSERSSTEPYFDEPIVIKPMNYTGRKTKSFNKLLNRANSQNNQ